MNERRARSDGQRRTGPQSVAPDYGALSAVLVLWSLFFCPSLSSATELELVGGPGGNLFRAECPQGAYLVGLAGRTGEWVDRIAPICAPWLRGSQAFGPPTIGPTFGASTGGQDRQRTCWADGNKTLAIQSWYVETIKSTNPPVQYLEIHCVSLGPAQAVGLFDFGNPTAASEERVSKGPYPHGCQPGEIASGFRVRAGLFVDALGLICRPIPPRVGAPAGKLPSPLVTAPPPAVTLNPQAKNLRIPEDLFVITKPTPGEQVPQGQLRITAIAPTVGVTNVSELELRYLDAPPKLQYSYPYLTIIATYTATLTQGYPIEPLVTSAYPGRWQVRARSAMKTPPGPWSAPVAFQVVAASPQQSSPFKTAPLPPSAIQQTPSLPAGPGSTNAPSPAPGTFSGTIRRRGLEGSETAHENQPSGRPVDGQQTR